MALTIKDIIEENMFPGTQLMTGFESAENLIHWVTVQEILDAVDSLSEGDLLLTTGFDLQDATRHQSLIARLKQNGVSGMMIQTGYYLEQIPVYLLEAGRKFQFPILEIPPRYKFSEVTKRLIKEIDKKSLVDDHSFIDYHFFSRYVKAAYQKALQQEEMDSQLPCLIAVTLADAYQCDKAKFEDILEQIRSMLADESDFYIGDFSYDRQGVFLISFAQERQLLRTLGNLNDCIVRTSDFEGIDLLASADYLQGVEEIKTAFAHCIDTLNMLHTVGARRGFCFYGHYHFVKRFSVLSRSDKNYAKEHEMLQCLIKKDKENNTAYVQTLRILLLENGNVSKAAKRLFIHRHTLLNRIEVIKELTGFNFEDYYERLSFQVALQIHDYYGN